MALFQSSVITKHLQNQHKENLALKWENFKNHFHNPRVQEEIKSLKEEQYQGEFLEDFFVKILGYTKPASSSETKFNLTTEYKNIKDSKKADGAIIVNDAVKAVIELKGTNTTDLGKIEVQAFGYKNNQPDCTYVITSNFEKLRFYIDNTIEHLEFNLFTLTEKEFNLLYLCLAYENIEKDIPKKIKDQSISQEDAITKKLYNDYSLFKRELHQSLVKLNPQFDALTLFQKSQKLLDRFLFLFFAEDRQLLPPNSVRMILDQWKQLKELDAYSPLFDRFKKYFGYLNTGFKGKQYDVFAYNGGLFLPDEVLDNITIDDDLLYLHTIKLSEYDFISEVDVNILGHIFENSLNELDEIKAQLAGETVDKTKTKRKKDGVFYTPKYITKYIVENTVGKLCVDKKSELEIAEDDYSTDQKRQKKTIKILLDRLTAYRNWLLQLTICDPACGSGAFLNQALDFLINEHKYIDELQAKLFGDAMVLSDVEKSILENNLFGVDLNEESVEIAKLSLWLRTAQPNRKLNDLNNNIKCGNSLIDDPEIAGDKAFNWQQEFPQIFTKGGFDVVIGNPPYVRLQNIDIESREYYNRHYKTAYKNYDLYVLFTERIKFLLNEQGLGSYIMPKKFITTEYGEKLKEFLFKENLLERFIDFSDFQIFQDATTYTGIFNFSRKEKLFFKYLKIQNDIPNFLNREELNEFDYSNLSHKNWIIMDKKPTVLFNKLFKLKKLKELSSSLYVGLQTSADPVFILEMKEGRLFSKFTEKYYDFNTDKILKPLLKGAEIKRYTTPIPIFKLIFPYEVKGDILNLISAEKMVENYPDIWSYLNECKDKLEGRENGKMKNNLWYGYVYLKNMTEFSKPKILTQVLCKNSSLTLDLDNNFHFVGGGTAGGYGVRIIDDINEFLLISILNSRLIQWYIRQFASPFQGGFYAYNKGTLGEIPLPHKYLNLDLAKELVLKINKQNDNSNIIIQKFESFFKSKFLIKKLSNKLHSWQELEFGEFTKELNKVIKKEGGRILTKKDEFEWMDLFEENKKKFQLQMNEIDNTEKEIDQMVYGLYGLTQEEIGIVENS